MKSFALACVLVSSLAISCATLAAERVKLSIPSTVDGIAQTCYLNLPQGYDRQGAVQPLVVLLHSWSGDVEQRNPPFEQAAEKRGWLALFPNFRGINDHPEACGSALAQQDILDAVQWVCDRYPVDKRRVYLTGVSGGGHMTMLMVGRHPQVWAAGSAWVGISNMASWHARHATDNYGEMTRKCCGGPPGMSAAVDNEYRQRSPLTHLAGAVGVPLDIAAGIHDGHQGSVPIRHSLDAFNMVAKAQKLPFIAETEIEQLGVLNGRLSQPQPSDIVTDDSFGRAIYLRREAGKCRVTIFEGGHEGIAEAAMEFLSRHTQNGPSASQP